MYLTTKRFERRGTSFAILGMTLLTSCYTTAVPIGTSTKALNSNVIGWWQPEEQDSVALNVEQSNTGYTLIQSWNYDWNKKMFVCQPRIDTLYFADLSDSQGKLSFVSVRMDSTDGYQTGRLRFLDRNTLKLGAMDIGSDFWDEHMAIGDESFRFSSVASFQAMTKKNMRNPALYHLNDDDKVHELKLFRRASFMDLHVPTTRAKPVPKPVKAVSTAPPKAPERHLQRNGSYGVDQIRTREYIRELGRWNDYGAWLDTDESVSVARFYPDEMMVRITLDGTETSFYGVNLSSAGTSKSSDGESTFYEYKGIAKHDGAIVGNFRIFILDATYLDLLNGKEDSYRFDMKIDYLISNIAERGFFGAALSGVDQLHMGFLINTR